MENTRDTSKPFVIRKAEVPREIFAKNFLGSHDFDSSSVKKISNLFGLGNSGTKKNSLDKLENYFYRGYSERDGWLILEQLIKRNKNWLTFRTGICNSIPNLQNPLEIIFSPGKSGWYGPIMVDNENWYICVNFIPQWEFDEISKQYQEYQIRWLCFARITNSFVSLHWQGFSLAEKKDLIDHENQFRYWEHIPSLFNDFQDKLGIKLQNPLLHNLVLYDLWDEFRLNPNYRWEDLRIRAESGGVSLNVQSPGKSASSNNEEDINISDIKHLAKTLSFSVTKELDLYPLDSQRQARLEESILRTLIREFGAKSYEFSLSTLEKPAKKILRAHFYFGTRPNIPSRDCFPHIYCYAKWGTDKDQFNFMLQYLKLGNANRQPEQVSFLK